MRQTTATAVIWHCPLEAREEHQPYVRAGQGYNRFYMFCPY